jgi:hypothetical protein
MQIVIEIDEDRYDEIMSMYWKNCRLIFGEEIRAIHDGKVLEQQPCEDCISRKEVISTIYDNKSDFKNDFAQGFFADKIKALPPVTSQPEVGRWIYDKNIDNWKCSECGETPKTMGYCGSVAFMAEHFKYCNHCGCKMQEVEE